MLKFVILTISVLVITEIKLSDSHGRLVEPPSRSSAWRYGFQTPHNYNDHELYCGGFSRQWNRNNGKCGECGDAWDLPKPRPNEFGGKYGLGVTVRNYKPAQVIELKVELTANHNGFFEFRVCPFITATQECFEKNQLTIFSDNDPNERLQFNPDRALGKMFTLYGILPKDFTCHRCVLQWRYVAGNNWGQCKNGTEAVGCGPQEEFRACADISILDENTLQTFAPPIIRTSSTSESPKTVFENETILTETEMAIERFVYSGFFIVLFSFVSVVCLFALLYICYYEDRIKKFIERKR